MSHGEEQLTLESPCSSGAPEPVDGVVVARAVLTEVLQDALRGLAGRLESLEAQLAELRDTIVSRNLVKEFYTTAEAGRILGRRPYTVREWCRLARINAVKSMSGRGIDEEWRISHRELRRIQNEGLLPANTRF